MKSHLKGEYVLSNLYIEFYISIYLSTFYDNPLAVRTRDQGRHPYRKERASWGLSHCRKGPYRPSVGSWAIRYLVVPSVTHSLDAVISSLERRASVSADCSVEGVGTMGLWRRVQ